MNGGYPQVEVGQVAIAATIQGSAEARWVDRSAGHNDGKEQDGRGHDLYRRTRTGQRVFGA